MDGLLIAATLFAGGYCWVLSRRVADLKSLDKGLGGSIVKMTRQIELARTTLEELKATAKGSETALTDLVAQSDIAIRDLRDAADAAQEAERALRFQISQAAEKTRQSARQQEEVLAAAQEIRAARLKPAPAPEPAPAPMPEAMPEPMPEPMPVNMPETVRQAPSRAAEPIAPARMPEPVAEAEPEIAAEAPAPVAEPVAGPKPVSGPAFEPISEPVSPAVSAPEDVRAEDARTEEPALVREAHDAPEDVSDDADPFDGQEPGSLVMLKPLKPRAARVTELPKPTALPSIGNPLRNRSALKPVESEDELIQALSALAGGGNR